MEASIDQGEQKRDVYLRPGDRVRLTFDDHLLLRLGNAGGVRLALDGQAYPLDAEPGEVRTLSFAAEE
jgi:cytoskeleton protein RodZ